MPHRTVFQIGENHVHPFTMFLGGVVVGSIGAGTVAWVWANQDSTDLNVQSTTVQSQKASTSASASPSPSVRPSASPSPGVSF